MTKDGLEYNVNPFVPSIMRDLSPLHKLVETDNTPCSKICGKINKVL